MVSLDKLTMILFVSSAGGAEGEEEVEMKQLTASTSSPATGEDQPDGGPDNIQVGLPL